MLFNSFEFAIFLPVVFLLYWFGTNKNLKVQNGFLVLVSYIFYGWWDWRFLSLIAFSSLVDYQIGLRLGRAEDQRRRKILLGISLGVNLGFLGLFKYYNFFATSFAEAFTLFGQDFSVDRLNIILPVGISFYTFQTLSYSIDVYRRKLEPTRDVVAFFAFVSFFPQLVAGPIERATHLLPQFYKKRHFNYALAVDGLRQILWGLFKKMVIADNCAMYVNQLFGGYEDYAGSTLLLGAVLFAFQIYGDFSGYSDIAIGTSKLFGFDLMTNFKYPYFSRDIAEFWRRWHISLSTWFRDYLYIPLGGSKGGTGMKVRNTFIIFLVSGFWHGANWTFIVWGGLNAVYFLPLLLTNQNRKNLNVASEGMIFPSLKELLQILTTFFLTTLAWVFFRSETIGDALGYLRRIFSKSLVSIPFHDLTRISQGADIIYLFLCIAILIFFEWSHRDKQHPLTSDNQTRGKWALAIKAIIVYMLIFCFAAVGKNEFIYFQF
jgi:alginate O-acetyltransferase complex protein AlgI